MNDILIYAELSRDKKPLNFVFELGNKACELAKKLDNCEVNALLITDTVQNLELFETSPFNKIFIAKHILLKDYNTDFYSKIAIDIINEQKPSIMLIGATSQGRDLAPNISASLGVGLTADCTGLEITEDKKLAATRPTFGGKLMATILSKTYPQMATVRGGVFKNTEKVKKQTEIVQVSPNIENKNKKVELLNFIKKIKNDNDLENAEIIVAGGKGLKTKENFDKIKIFAEKIGASVAATRTAVELGWITSDFQVGQTGLTVTPKIYIAFGISGAVQHLVGMENSAHIIAINNDKNAPIFRFADFGIVSDAVKILDELLK